MKRISIALLSLATFALLAAGCNKQPAPAPAPAPTPVVEKPAPKYSVGEKVDVKWQGGSWYAATVTAVNSDGTYNVTFFDNTTQNSTKEADVQELPEVTTTFKVGDKVKARWHGGGTWDAVVSTVAEDGTYEVTYDSDQTKESGLWPELLMAR